MVLSGFEQKLVLQRKKMGHRKYKSLSSTNKYMAGLGKKKKISLNPSEHGLQSCIISPSYWCKEHVSIGIGTYRDLQIKWILLQHCKVFARKAVYFLWLLCISLRMCYLYRIRALVYMCHLPKCQWKSCSPWQGDDWIISTLTT